MPTATRRLVRRTAAQADTAAPPRIATPQSFILAIEDIAPYEYNPRKNERAIESVANSIRSYGFMVPVVIDENNVLVTGHTRIEAAKTLDMTEVTAIRAEHLSPEAIAQFRIVDNKVAEIAEWDHELLAEEIAKLEPFGIDWTAFGFTQNEIDCLSQLVGEDCLDVAELNSAAAQAEQRTNDAVRAPMMTRFVMGEIVFFVPQSQYRAWLNGVRSLHDFDKDAVENEIMERLGLNQHE